MDEIDQHDKITLWLPLKPTTAGNVLQHCCRVMETLFETYDPCIFKVGFTRHPIIRWENRKYGYSRDRERWERMVILFTSTEPWSAAMLEAALIHEFGGHSEALSWRALALLQVKLMIKIYMIL